MDTESLEIKLREGLQQSEAADEKIRALTKRKKIVKNFAHLVKTLRDLHMQPGKLVRIHAKDNPGASVVLEVYSVNVDMIILKFPGEFEIPEYNYNNVFPGIYVKYRIDRYTVGVAFVLFTDHVHATVCPNPENNVKSINVQWNKVEEVYPTLDEALKGSKPKLKLTHGGVDEGLVG